MHFDAAFFAAHTATVLRHRTCTVKEDNTTSTVIHTTYYTYKITSLQVHPFLIQMCTPFQAKLTKAQNNCVDFPSVLCEPLLALCVAMSDAIGCPLEFIVFPLITISAACMGANAHVAINEMWKEPAILWLIVASKDKRRLQLFDYLRNLLKRLSVWNQKIGDVSKNILQQHQLTTHLSCVLTTSALRNYIM